MNKKILYITKELPYGSSEAFIYAEINWLLKNGFDVNIAPVRPSAMTHNKGRDLLDVTIAKPLISFEMATSFILKFLSSPKELCRVLYSTINWNKPRLIPRNIAVWIKSVWLSEQVKKQGFDHIHSHWLAVPSTMAMIVSKLSGVEFSITAHRYDIAQGNLVQEKSDAAKFIRAIDIPGRSEIISQQHISNRPPILIRMGVDLPNQMAPFRKGVLTSLHAIIGARLVEKKGHTTLIDAISIAKQNGLLVHIDCYGDGPLLSKLEAYAQEKGVRDLVTFKGVASHEYLQERLLSGDYDVAVMPSVTASDGDKEGIPVFLMEAMAVGLPVIATDNGGIPELIDENSGIIVKEFDAIGLCEAFISIAKSEEERLKFSTNSKIKVKKDFSIDGCMIELQYNFFK